MELIDVVVVVVVVVGPGVGVGAGVVVRQHMAVHPDPLQQPTSPQFFQSDPNFWAQF